MFGKCTVVLGLVLLSATRVTGQKQEVSGCLPESDIPSTVRCDNITLPIVKRNCTCRSNCQNVEIKCDSDGKWRQFGQSPCDMLTFQVNGTDGLNISFDHGNFSFSCKEGSKLTSHIEPVLCKDGAVVGLKVPWQVPRCFKEYKDNKTHLSISINEKIATTQINKNTTIGNASDPSALLKSSQKTEINIVIILVSSLFGLFVLIMIIVSIIWLSRKYRCCTKNSGYTNTDDLQTTPKFEMPMRPQLSINTSYSRMRAASSRVDSLKPINEEEEHIYDVIDELIYDDVGPPSQ